MATEIERKYLVNGDAWRDAAHRQVRYRQGYLASTSRGTVRVRIGGDVAYLNVKSATVGATRLEFEYPIAVADAEAMLETLCEGSIIEKTRYFVRHGDTEWEVDVFEGDNAGLVVAEIELADEAQIVSLPEWAGEEVTHDVRYYNSNLAITPFRDW